MVYVYSVLAGVAIALTLYNTIRSFIDDKKGGDNDD